MVEQGIARACIFYAINRAVTMSSIVAVYDAAAAAAATTTDYDARGIHPSPPSLVLLTVGDSR